MTHFPWDLIILAVLVIAVGVVLFVVLGRRIGAQGVRQIPPGPDARRSDGRSGLKKDNLFMPRPSSSRSGTEGPDISAHGEEKGKDSRLPPPLPSAAEAGRKAALSSALMSVISRDTPSEAAHETEPYQSGPALYVVPKKDTDLAQKISDVKQVLPSFQAESFLRETDRAFRSVVSGYAAGDRAALEPFVSPESLEVFMRAVEKRKETDHTEHFALRHLERLQIQNVVIDETQIRIAVAITSWQINYQTNKENVVTEGVESLTEFHDLWWFAHKRPDVALADQSSVSVKTGGENGWVLIGNSVF